MKATGLYPELNHDNLSDILRSRNSYPYDELTQEDYKQTVKLSFYSTKKEELEKLMNILPDTVVGYFDNMSDMMSTGEFYMRDTSKDNLNDMEMVEFAHIGIAMGNGCDALKNKADFVTKHISDDGFAYAFEALELI